MAINDGASAFFFRQPGCDGVAAPRRATALALALANTCFGPVVEQVLHLRIGGTVDGLSFVKSIGHWINDGLMVIFFLLVGMEIKREVVEGDLSQPSKVALPIAGALGGIILPAVVYVGFTWNDVLALHGWAVPSATDIAFAITVLALLGARVSPELRLFLLTLAVVDDLAAILIIAIFYTGHLSTLSLALAGLCISALLALNLAGVRRFHPYLLLGMALWLCVLKSGVHATLSGVALAFLLPLKGGGEATDRRAFIRLEQALRPWVKFLVMPVFAFANSGLSFAGITSDTITHPITLGVAVGLLFGKQLGIFAAAGGLIRLGYARLPAGATWWHLYGASICGGIGFTMSLFIGSLAFEDAELEPLVRLGVLGASVISAAGGYAVLRLAPQR